jgi:hypothetical protein
MKKNFVLALLLAALAGFPLRALADTPSVGISAIFTTGTTREGGGVTRLPLLPVPMLSLRVPLRRFEIFAEGVPPIGPVSYGPAPARVHGYFHGTKLSYAFAALRYRFGNAFSVGFGETLYNQATQTGRAYTFSETITTPQGSFPTTFSSSNRVVDSSRVAGARYEMQAAFNLGTAPFTAALALTPTMHAIIRSGFFYEDTVTSGLGNHFYKESWSQNAPETASEVDASISSARSFGSFRVSYGLRYLNYISRYDRSHALADRDTLLLPFIGVERRLGR